MTKNDQSTEGETPNMKQTITAKEAYRLLMSDIKCAVDVFSGEPVISEKAVSAPTV